MWALIIERLLYFRSVDEKDVERRFTINWEARSERRSWHAHMIREGLISQFSHGDE